MHDLIVVGGGPAGMTAALYALRNGKTVLVIEKSSFGGQITHSPKVENYPGTRQISGNALADAMLEQILALGAEIELENVVGIQCQGSVRIVSTEEGSAYPCRAVVIATGVRHRMLGLPGENDLIGEGISFCAVCDGDFYTGEDVCVAGGGNSALQEALLLADKCRSVTVVQDLEVLTGEMPLQEHLRARGNVQVLCGARITGLEQKDGSLTGLSVTLSDGTRRSLACSGLFVSIGLIPENGAFADLADLDARGYFASDENCLTRTPGVFVAGDCRSKGTRQLTTAVADGACAALAACRWISLQEE